MVKPCKTFINMDSWKIDRMFLYVAICVLSQVQWHSAMVITRNDTILIEEQNCTFTSTDMTSVHCTQYRLPNNYCGRGRELFPEVYMYRQDAFPNSPREVTQHNGTLVTWKPQFDGGVTCLKGFEVTLQGLTSDYPATRCAILVLENVTTALMRVTFSVEFELAVGQFNASVKSLPPSNRGPAEVGRPEPVSAEKAQSNAVCIWPNLTVGIHFKEVNTTVINMTFNPDPAAAIKYGYTVYKVTVYTDMKRRMYEQSDSYIGAKSLEGSHSRLFVDLPPGNYTVRVTPIDEHEYDTHQCLCYVGFKGQDHPRVCRPRCCLGPVSESPLSIPLFPRKLAETIATTNGYSGSPPVSRVDELSKFDEFSLIGIPVLSVLGVIIGILIIWALVCRNRINHWKCLNINREYGNQSDSLLCNRGLTGLCGSCKKSDGSPFKREKHSVITIFTPDHDAHTQAVTSFTVYMRSLCFHKVKQVQCFQAAISNTTANKQSRRKQLCEIINNADVIIFIHSETSFKFGMSSNSGKGYSVDRTVYDYDEFTQCFYHASSIGKSNIISVYFHYTPESFVIRSPTATDSVFKLPAQADEFKQCTMQTLGNPGTPNKSSYRERSALSALKSKILAASRYQTSRPDWFKENAGHRKTSYVDECPSLAISCDFHDYNTVSTTLQNGQSSFTSRSTSFANNWARELYETAGHGSKGRIGYINTSSFIKPDEDLYTEASESLLCRTMNDINERYDFVVTRIQEDDCVTVGPVVSA